MPLRLTELEHKLLRLEKSVAAAKYVVDEERERLTKLKAQGHQIADTETMLAKCADTLTSLERRERKMRQQLACARAMLNSTSDDEA
jgi:septal ring factor EnvC (AmiA/AmiB activator)